MRTFQTDFSESGGHGGNLPPSALGFAARSITYRAARKIIPGATGGNLVHRHFDSRRDPHFLLNQWINPSMNQFLTSQSPHRSIPQ